VSPEAAQRVVAALHGLCLANWSDFCRYPEALRAYERNLRAGRHVYVSDQLTCGRPDCWSTYRDLVKRYPSGSEPLMLDCEDAASAHIAYLAATCHQDLYMGLICGNPISHAVGAVKKNGKIVIVDPSRWYGMGETVYDNPVLRKVC
jgi:hypothetical protein